MQIDPPIFTATWYIIDYIACLLIRLLSYHYFFAGQFLGALYVHLTFEYLLAESTTIYTSEHLIILGLKVLKNKIFGQNLTFKVNFLG